MCALVDSLAKLTFDLLSKKARSYGAKKLQNGGLVDQECRSILLGELDVIKHQLTAISRRELKNGISCFKRGVERLNVAFSDSVDSGIPRSRLPNATQKQSEDSALASTEQASDLLTGIEGVLAKAQAVESKHAEESFNNAARDAGLAFNNDNLSTADKILACAVCIASRILEHSTYPKLAVSDCIGYLKELNSLPAIFDEFDVYATGGIKSFIYKEQREKIVESVIAINSFLLKFITTFSNEGKTFNGFDWPLVESTTDANVYHPIYYEFMIAKEAKEITPPWCIRALLHYSGVSAVNSKGDLVLSRRYHEACFLVKFNRETGKSEKLKIPALDEKKAEDINRNYLAVDKNDTLFLLTRYDRGMRYDLSVCNSNGVVFHQQPLEFLEGKECRCFRVTENGRLVFCCEFEKTGYNLYTSDGSGQLKNCFPVRVTANLVVKDMFISRCNEVVLVAVKEKVKSRILTLHVNSMEGRLERTVNLKLPDDSGYACTCAVAYDYSASNIVCLTSTTTFRAWRYLRFGEAGELLSSCDLSMYDQQLGFMKPNISSHPKGAVAFICQNGVLYI